MSDGDNFNFLSKHLISPLRYPGSKRRLVPFIKEILELNSFHPFVYVEPFLGGGSVALQLMQDGCVDRVILMDLDPWISSFWQTVFFDTEWLIDQIETIDVTVEHWQEFKSRVPVTIREQALTCLFLNRTSFSGIIRDEVGPIGGKEQKSDYPIDCRFPKQTLINRIQEAAFHRDKVFAIWNCSWEDGVDQLRSEQRNNRLPKEGLLFYLDPPFFEEANKLYRFFFHEDDHLKLRDFLMKLADQWILSYDSVTAVEALYGDAIKKGTNGTSRHDVELPYSLAIMSRRKGKEAIITNLEKLPSPAKSTD